MHEDRSGSEQQPPEYQSAWPASHDGSDDYVAQSDGDPDQARHDVASAAPGDQSTQPAAAGPLPAGQASGPQPGPLAGADQPAAGSPDQPAAADQPAAGITDQPASADRPAAGGAGQPGAGGYENPTMIYAPPGSYPAGSGDPGTQGGHGPGGSGYEASGYGPGYGGEPGYGGGAGYGGEPGYGGSGYGGSAYGGGGSAYGGEPGYGGVSAYGGGYGGSGYQGGYGYGPGGYGPGGYGPGGYPPGGTGYGTPGGYGPDDVIGYRDRPPKRGSRIVTYVVVAALAAGVGAGTVLALNHNSGNSSPNIAAPNPGFGGAGGGSGGGFGGAGAPTGGGNGISNAKVAAAASKVSPGIVDIISRPKYQSGTLEGTGMILNSTGLVLTNNHVVQGTSKWTVKIADTGRTYRNVTVLGTDATDDVALLQLNGASGLHPIPHANSDSVHKGDQVVALGNAEGRDGKPNVVAGRVTALNRSIKATDQGAGTTENLHGMLETNAPIISGDSGGALANMQGQVIGMNTAANSSASIGGGQSGASMGFAIPINTALSIATLIDQGKPSSKVQIGLPAFLGVTVASQKSGPSTSADPKVQQHQLRSANRQSGGFGGFGGGAPSSGGSSSNSCLNINAQTSAPSRIAPVSSGTLVSGVLCGTPVDQVGMTAGAVITSINGQAIASPASLTQNLTQYHPGATISVQWVAPNGQHHTSSLKLAAGPAK